MNFSLFPKAYSNSESRLNYKPIVILRIKNKGYRKKVLDMFVSSLDQASFGIIVSDAVGCGDSFPSI